MKRLITSVCRDCCEEFTFEVSTSIGGGRRQFCTECAKRRKARQDRGYRNHHMSKGEAEIARMYSPFTPYGPSPLPHDLVEPHECTTFIRTTRINGETYKTEFRK